MRLLVDRAQALALTVRREVVLLREVDDALLHAQCVHADVGEVDDWEWTGPTPGFAEIAGYLDAPALAERAARAAEARG